LTIPSSKERGFSGYALRNRIRYLLNGLPDRNYVERMGTLKILHRQGLQPATSYLQLLKNYGRQMLSLFRFLHFQPTNITDTVARFGEGVKSDSSPVLKYGVFSGVSINKRRREANAKN